MPSALSLPIASGEAKPYHQSVTASPSSVRAAPSLPPSPSPDGPRVAHLIRPAMGGIRSQTRSLVLAQTTETIAPLVAAPPDVAGFVADGLPNVTRLPLPAAFSPATLFRQGMRAGRWAKQNGAELLHGHGVRWSPLFWAASLVSGLPLVVTLHNLLPSALSAAERAVLLLTLGRASRLLAVSQAVAQSAKVVASEGKLCVVYNGVDTARFIDSELPTKNQARAQLGVPQTARVVACVARLSPEKNVGLALEAVSLLPETFLLVVGDGPRRLALEMQAQALRLQDRVLFTGERRDIPQLLRAADVYCQPSQEEGLGIAVLEAMASGLPVVASNVGGLREVVTSETGTLLTPTNPRNWADALLTLRPEQGRSGQARVQSRFSVQAMHENTRRVYDEVLQTKHLTGQGAS